MNKLFIIMTVLGSLVLTNHVFAGPYGSLRHGVVPVAVIPGGAGFPENKDIKWLVGKTVCFRYASADISTEDCLTVLRVRLYSSFVSDELHINDGSFIFTKTHVAGHPTEQSQAYSTAANGFWSRDAEVISVE